MEIGLLVPGLVQEPAERARYAERVAASVRTALQRAKVRGVFFGVLTFSTFAGIVFVLWQGGLLVLDGKLTAGSLVSFLLYTVTIAASIGALASSFSAYQEAVGAAERVFEILEMRPEIADPAEPETLATPVGGRVEFEDVSFRYTQGEETWTLEDVTLRVAPGEVVALVGPSGGGKTTLVSLLSRFWDVDRGHVRLDGHDVRAIRLADLRGSIGIVPQEPALFSGSVRENIAYARPGASAAEVEAAARKKLNARMLVPLTRGQGGAALQFEVELPNLEQFEEFREKGIESDRETGNWMHKFSEILTAPPQVELLRVEEKQAG